MTASMGVSVVTAEPPKPLAKAPQQAPQAAPAPNCASYANLVAQYDWDAATALAIMRAESGCDPNAVNHNANGTQDKGLYQLNDVHVKSGLITDEGRLDPAQNIKAAYAIHRGSGWHAWSSFTSGAYLRYR